ncbi:MAG: sigma-54-dependent Fis family transcriptional regulator, partial [Desulfobacterales bacterium]|nr:sigma-54-dependent Fis family transcriptional regulator [Desulfobacterales bacterium]
FTGAEANRAGLIERASGGTLFLDEIGDLNHFSQVKLLRLLQEEEYMPLGEDIPRRSDARIVASTHADLWELQHTERFRQDLHYRLRTHRVWIPPLRERKEDLGLLVDHFLVQASESLDKDKPAIDSNLIPLLETYSFPGNVRELMAMVYDAMAQHQSGQLSSEPFRIHMEHLRTRAI